MFLARETNIYVFIFEKYMSRVSWWRNFKEESWKKFPRVQKKKDFVLLCLFHSFNFQLVCKVYQKSEVVSNISESCTIATKIIRSLFYHGHLRDLRYINWGKVQFTEKILNRTKYFLVHFSFYTIQQRSIPTKIQNNNKSLLATEKR